MASRRSLILGAAFGVTAAPLVRATSLIDLPGDPLTKRGLQAAAVWATEEYREQPGCRLIYASGQATRWFTYQHLRRTTGEGKPDYAVAIETAVTDGQGRRFVHSTPVDAVGVERIAEERLAKAYKLHMDDWGWA